MYRKLIILLYMWLVSQRKQKPKVYLRPILLARGIKQTLPRLQVQDSNPVPNWQLNVERGEKVGKNNNNKASRFALVC